MESTDMASDRRDIDDIEETEAAILQRLQLTRVRSFLLEHAAEEDLVETIDIAIEDIERWICTEIEAALQNGTLQPGEA